MEEARAAAQRERDPRRPSAHVRASSIPRPLERAAGRVSRPQHASRSVSMSMCMHLALYSAGDLLLGRAVFRHSVSVRHLELLSDLGETYLGPCSSLFALRCTMWYYV